MTDNNIKFVPLTFDPMNWKFFTDEEMTNLNMPSEPDYAGTDFSGFGTPKKTTTNSEGWVGKRPTTNIGSIAEKTGLKHNDIPLAKIEVNELKGFPNFK